MCLVEGDGLLTKTFGYPSDKNNFLYNSEINSPVKYLERGAFSLFFRPFKEFMAFVGIYVIQSHSLKYSC